VKALVTPLGCLIISRQSGVGQHLACPGTEALVVEVFIDINADNKVAIPQLSFAGEVVEGGEQLATCQVTQRAENKEKMLHFLGRHFTSLS